MNSKRIIATILVSGAILLPAFTALADVGDGSCGINQQAVETGDIVCDYRPVSSYDGGVTWNYAYFCENEYTCVDIAPQIPIVSYCFDASLSSDCIQQ